MTGDSEAQAGAAPKDPQTHAVGSSAAPPVNQPPASSPGNGDENVPLEADEAETVRVGSQAGGAHLC